jgi:hypothetical protein
LGELARGFVKENSLVCEMCNFTHQQKMKETVHILYKTKYGSKGYYLEAQVSKHSHPENKIVWWWESSQGIEERFNWLRANVQQKNN